MSLNVKQGKAMTKFSYQPAQIPIVLVISYEDDRLCEIDMEHAAPCRKEKCRSSSKANSELEQKLVKDFRDYFCGKPVKFKYKMSLDSLTDFQKQVLRILARIPKGRVESYGSIAKKTGRPGAARAVGSACGRNPLPIVIPCHRVIKADGSLGGFGCGIDLKKLLLGLENYPIEN